MFILRQDDVEVVAESIEASSAGIGVFEVGLALRGKQELALMQYQIALMFTECSLVMFVVQGMVFAPWVKPETTRWLIAPALSVLATGLFLVPRASDFTLMLTVVGGGSGERRHPFADPDLLALEQGR